MLCKASPEKGQIWKWCFAFRSLGINITSIFCHKCPYPTKSLQSWQVTPQLLLVGNILAMGTMRVLSYHSFPQILKEILSQMQLCLFFSYSSENMNKPLHACTFVMRKFCPVLDRIYW